jgi:hypothetical protein
LAKSGRGQKKAKIERKQAGGERGEEGDNKGSVNPYVTHHVARWREPQHGLLGVYEFVRVEDVGEKIHIIIAGEGLTSNRNPKSRAAAPGAAVLTILTLYTVYPFCFLCGK